MRKAARCVGSAEVRAALLAGREIALLDAREEAVHATGHPLFAANLPLSRLEFETDERMPRRSVPIVVLDDGEGLAALAADRLTALGYSDVSQLTGGLRGWREAGGELFRDVNAPSKAFGELVESQRHTPSLSAAEVKALIDAGGGTVIVDVRPFDEYRTMNIPGAISVPGVELALRIGEIAPDPRTRVVVNCAGRTRGIIGTQSLVNAGVPNPVAALRNGTIGWTLAGYALEHGAARRFPEVTPDARTRAAVPARRLAERAGVRRVGPETLNRWIARGDRTVYRFDVRTSEEYESGHLPGFRGAPGGQLVQETDFYAPVRGARLVLADDDGVRANMTASWLAQMGWSVFVIDEVPAEARNEIGRWPSPLPPLPVLPAHSVVSAAEVLEWLKQEGGVVIFDLAPSGQYSRSHIPGSWFASRTDLARAREAAPDAARWVLTSPDGLAARFAWKEAAAIARRPLFVLEGGTAAWSRAGLPLVASEPRHASEPIDRYRRPYEGVDVPAAAMQAYLDWEYGLVDQLRRDGTHGFRVIQPEAS
jgi:rhodanese-related sulfurtransferase